MLGCSECAPLIEAEAGKVAALGTAAEQAAQGDRWAKGGVVLGWDCPAMLTKILG